ncbi:MAG TPA: terminase gpA endonuclease subunit [Paracoccaceae bacterium]|nr:terminase gpA endonuclease subunit [Paracoccaceae bacterium]
MAPIAEAMPQPSAVIQPTRMPTRRADSGLPAAARMARPMRVRRKKSVRAPRWMSVTAIITARWVQTRPLTWEDRGGEAIEPEGLAGRRERFGELLPDGVAVLTAGIDVQKDRLEVQIVGWGRDEEAWVTTHRQLWGDPSGPNVWADLDHLLLGAWPHAREMPDLPIRAACLDSGGHHTAVAYEFARTRLRRRIWAVKGRGGMGLRPWPRRASAGKGGAPVFIVGVDAAKA